MKFRFAIVALLSLVVSTLHGADAETKYWPGWYSCQVKVARVRAAVTYTNMVPGQAISISRVLDNGGSFSFTVPNENGVYYSAYTTYGANCAQEGECTLSDWTAVSVSAGVGSSGGGGRPVTGLIRQDGGGPNSCVAVIQNDVDITYNVSKPPPVCNWSVGGSLTGACPTTEHTWSIFHDGIEVAGGSFTGSTAINASGSTGGGIMMAVDGNTVQNWTTVCSGDPPPSNAFTINATVGTECTPTPSPTPTATPTPSATPIPTPTPGENYAPPNPTPPYQQPPGGGTNPPSNPPQIPPNSTPYPTGNDGNVHITNADDIYKPILDAINGTDQADVPAPTINSGFETGFQPAAIANDQSSAVQQSLDSGRAKHSEAVASGSSKLGSLQTLQLSTGGITNKMSWAVTLPKLGSFTIDVSPYSSTISIMRALLLMILLIGAWFSTVKIIRSAIA